MAQMFSSLSNYNFRLFFAAQSFSVIGTFGQELAMAWYMLILTGSPTAVGIMVGLQFTPVLILGPWGGVLADRFSRRKLLLTTQSIQGILSFTLWGLVVTGHAGPWTLYIIALGIGLAGAVNTPARLTFLHELVGKTDLHNAVSLNSTVYSAGRVVGPALAGITIALSGVAPVFLFNALTFIGVIAALIGLDAKKFHYEAKSDRATGGLRAGIKYAMRTPEIAAALLLVLIVGIFTYEFPTSLAALAKITFHGNATTLAVLSSSYGLGAVMGGLFSARRKASGVSSLVKSSALLGLTVLITAFGPTLWLMAALLVTVGFSTIGFASRANSFIQLTAEPTMRGRVIALYTAAWVGSAAVGGPLIGWLCEHMSPRYGLGLGGVAALIAAGLGVLMLKHNPSPDSSLKPDSRSSNLA